MIPTPQELDRLEQQARVRLQWIEDVRNGRSVTVDYRRVGVADWHVAVDGERICWDIDHDYKLSYPNQPKEVRVPRKGEEILVKSCASDTWQKRPFDHLFGNACFTRGDGAYIISWNFWKFPNEPEQVKEVKTFKDVETTMEDWVGGWWVKHKAWGISKRLWVYEVMGHGISFGTDFKTYAQLFQNDGWLRSRDGVEWERCVKKVEVME